jgi:histone acetyltransferase (RNA polymerase elongator complex component)
MNEMFDDLDPYERMIMMQARIEQLEQIQEEIIKNIQITGAHLHALSTAINDLQKNYVEVLRAAYAVNNTGDKQ